MANKGCNGAPSLICSAHPIQSPVSHENVSYDLDGLEQVYDIISGLPLQRNGTENPESLILQVTKLKFPKNEMLQTEVAKRVESAQLNKKRYTVEAKGEDRGKESRTLDTGNLNLIFSL